MRTLTLATKVAIVALVAATLLSCQKQATQPSAVSATSQSNAALLTWHFSVPVDDIEWDECAQEDVQIKGFLEVTTVVTQSAPDVFNLAFAATSKGITATGLTSGLVSKVLSLAAQEVTYSSDDGAANKLVRVFKLYFISAGGIYSLYTINFHFIIKEDGTVVLDSFTKNIECK